VKATRTISKGRRGFTMLELVIAIGMLVILIGMVFGIARTSLALGNRVIESQSEEMHKQAFFELLNNRFAALPGNARFDLQYESAGAQYLSDLTLQNVPMSFTWGGEARTARAVQLSTVRRRSGFLGIVLRYYENEILPDSEATSNFTTTQDNAPFAEISLIEDVAYFEWRVLDGRTMEWQENWDLQGRLPLQIELVMAIGAQGEEMRQIFWIPPKQNPELLMRQMLQGGAQGGGGGGEGALIGGPGGPDGVNIPGLGGAGGGRGGPGGGRGGPGGGRGGPGGGGGGGGGPAGGAPPGGGTITIPVQ